jgi:hypothetical protein
MTQGHVKVFTGNSIFANRLGNLLREANIPTIIKDQVASGVLAGFGTLDRAIELYVQDTDLEKANEIINAFQKEISE